MKYEIGLVLRQAGYSGVKMDELNDIRESISVNKSGVAVNASQIENNKEDITSNRQNVGLLFRGQEEIKIELSKLIGKILGGTAAIVALSQLAIHYFL